MEAIKEKMVLEANQKPNEEQKSFDFEDAVRQFIMNKEIAKERSEEANLILEKIQEEFESINGHELVIDLPSGEFGRVYRKATIKEVLDKDLLVDKINRNSNNEQSYIAKEDLKTPWDFSMLTKQERITPKMIAECTETQTTLSTKVTKVKRKPKAGKKT